MANTKTETKIRPSPTESATEFEIGTIRIGNDGNEYIIAADKNGKHRWAKHNVTKATKTAKPAKKVQIVEPEPIEVAEPEPKPEPVKPTKAPKTKKASKKQVAEPIEVAEPEKIEEPIVEEEEPAKKKKVNVRKAPMEHAKDFEEGYKKMGQDGEFHVVTLTKNGVKRWTRV